MSLVTSGLLIWPRGIGLSDFCYNGIRFLLLSMLIYWAPICMTLLSMLLVLAWLFLIPISTFILPVLNTCILPLMSGKPLLFPPRVALGTFGFLKAYYVRAASLTFPAPEPAPPSLLVRMPWEEFNWSLLKALPLYVRFPLSLASSVALTSSLNECLIMRRSTGFSRIRSVSFFTGIPMMLFVGFLTAISEGPTVIRPVEFANR